MQNQNNNEHSTQAHHEKHHIFWKKIVMQYILNTGNKQPKYNAPTFRPDRHILCLLHCADSNKNIIAIGHAWLYCYRQQNCCSNWPLYHCSSSNVVAAGEQENHRGNCHAGCHVWLYLQQQGIQQQRSGAACCSAPLQYNTLVCMHPLAAEVLGWQASGKQIRGQADKELGWDESTQRGKN